jgi:hypothetical protein
VMRCRRDDEREDADLHARSRVARAFGLPRPAADGQHTSNTHQRQRVKQALQRVMDLVGEAFVANPLEDGQELNKELEGDSDAVVSVFYPEQRRIGELMSGPDGGPSALYRVQQTAVLGYACTHWIGAAEGYAERGGMAKPNDLQYVAAGLGGCALAIQLVTLESARLALQPGGVLEQLGVGKQMISLPARKSMARWRVGLAVVCVPFQLISFPLVISMVAGMVNGDTETGVLGQTNKVLWTLWAWLIAPVVLLGWWPTASCLCRDNITEAIKKIRAIDPAAEEGKAWEREVETPVLALRESMGTLSRGYGRGLLAIGCSLVFFGVTFFCHGINVEMNQARDAREGHSPGFTRNRQLAMATFPPFLALLLARDLATTSSRCDLLMDHLNDADIKHGVQHHPKIDWLTVTLQRLVRPHSLRLAHFEAPACVRWRMATTAHSACTRAHTPGRCCVVACVRQNYGQGLGFKLGHGVIDRKTLAHAAVKLAGAFTTVYTILLAIVEESTALSVGGLCELSELQTRMVQTTFAERNASCSLDNITLGSILDKA